MEHSMKKLLVIVALATVLPAPAFAQQASNARRDAQTSRQQWSSRVHVYAPDYYEAWHGNRNLDPDFQSGYSR
jgi:Ni/Co efflux regulator RcnB